MGSETRFTRYAVIDQVTDEDDPYHEQEVVAYRVCKPTTKELKLPILTGLVNLMHKRFILRQLVHFHHTKVALSAMIIEAANFYLDFKARKPSEDSGKVYSLARTQIKREFETTLIEEGFGDDRLVSFLYKDKEAQRVVETKYLIERYVSRRPYKKVIVDWRERTYDELSQTPNSFLSFITRSRWVSFLVFIPNSRREKPSVERTVSAASRRSSLYFSLS